MKVSVSLSDKDLAIDGLHFGVSCNVRSLANGQRRTDEVIRSVPEGKPYDPRPFPKGTWKITAVEWQPDYGFSIDTYGPVKIRTDAFQPVKVWALDDDGDYAYETAEIIIDRGYLLHFSPSKTTWGCIRKESPEDAITIGKMIEEALDTDEEVILEVL